MPEGGVDLRTAEPVTGPVNNQHEQKAAAKTQKRSPEKRQHNLHEQSLEIDGLRPCVRKCGSHESAYKGMG